MRDLVPRAMQKTGGMGDLLGIAGEWQVSRFHGIFTMDIFAERQKAEIWGRWWRREAMRSIGRLHDRGSSSIYLLFARAAGIRPPERRILYVMLVKSITQRNRQAGD